MMTRTRGFAFASAVALALGGAGSAHAMSMSVDYVLDSVDLSYNATDPGLVVHVHQHSLPPMFTLEDGQSHTFKLFDIWTHESWVNNDDKIAKPISATLNFSSPASSGTVEGSTVGESHSAFFGLLNWQYGKLTWDGPTTVDLGNIVYQITLSDAKFNKGFWGLDSGWCDGATVYATVSQVSSVIPTPTAALAGLAMIAGFAARRRRAA
jgi:MYXO-CTERM domain-containing protein